MRKVLKASYVFSSFLKKKKKNEGVYNSHSTFLDSQMGQIDKRALC